MKIRSILVSILTLTLFAGIASAAKGTKAQTVAGTITKIDGATITLQPHVTKGAPDAAPVVITTADSTTVTVNGEKKALTDIVVGEKIKVTLDTDGKTATAITVGKKNANPAPAADAPATAPSTQPAK